MRRPAFLAALSGAALAVGMSLAAAPASAMTNSTFYGRIDHVSSDNIKVTDPRNGQSLSFLLVPKFKQIFSDDGKTTYQMSFLRPGTPVEVLYDQKALGARHADKIIVLKRLPSK